MIHTYTEIEALQKQLEQNDRDWFRYGVCRDFLETLWAWITVEP